MKLKIDNDLLAEEFFEDTRMLGIVAPVKNYQFVWHINQKFGFKFEINHSMEIQLIKKNRKYFFSVYDFNVPNRFLSHYIYQNQHDGEFLLPEFRHLDFLWLTKGDEVGTDELNDLLQAVRKLPSVQLVNEMSNEKIKNKQHLIF